MADFVGITVGAETATAEPRHRAEPLDLPPSAPFVLFGQGRGRGAAARRGWRQHGAPVGLSLLEGASERVFAGKLERAGFTEVWVGGHRPFGTDQAALYPLFTPEVIQVMRRTIPPAIRAMWPPG